MRPFETFELAVDLTPEEGRRKLSSRRGAASIAMSFLGPVVHLVAPARWRGVSRTGNSFQPNLFCRFAKERSGTILRCTVSPNPVVLVFMVIWFGPLSAVLVVGTLAELALGRPAMSVFIFLFISGMLTAGANLVRHGWRMGQPDIAFMHGWLIEALQARDVGGAPQLSGASGKMPMAAPASGRTAAAASTSDEAPSFLRRNWHRFLLYPAMVVGIPSFGFLIVAPQMLMAGAPRMADPASGKIWPWNNHGVFYITHDWYAALNLAQHVVSVAWPLMIASGFIEAGRKKDKEREILQEIMRRHADD